MHFPESRRDKGALICGRSPHDKLLHFVSNRLAVGYRARSVGGSYADSTISSTAGHGQSFTLTDRLRVGAVLVGRHLRWAFHADQFCTGRTLRGAFHAWLLYSSAFSGILCGRHSYAEGGLADGLSAHLVFLFAIRNLSSY